MKAEEITPEDPSFCSAKCWPVLIAGRIKAALIFPLVVGYPENKMELIAPQNLKATLIANTGDILEVEILQNGK